MSETVLIEIARLVGVFVVAWLGVRVEMRWLRSDVNRAHSLLNQHDGRLRRLELKR